jgi:hypothetical protein
LLGSKFKLPPGKSWVTEQKLTVLSLDLGNIWKSCSELSVLGAAEAGHTLSRRPPLG